jgi:hypothetical protein
VEVTGLLEDECWLPVFNNGEQISKWREYLFEIQFFHGATREEILAMSEAERDPYRGLSGLDGQSERNVNAVMHTVYDPDWILVARDIQGSGNVYNHLNVVDVGRYYSAANPTQKRAADKEAGARAVDKIAPRGTHTSKRVLRDYNTITSGASTAMYQEVRADGNKYPIIMFQIAVTGVETKEPLIITDKFDTDIWQVWLRDSGMYKYEKDGVLAEYWAHNLIPRYGAYDTGDWVNTSTPTKENPNPDNPITWHWQSWNCWAKDKPHLHREGTIVEEIEGGVRFTIDNVPTKPNGKFWNTYLVEYYLTPKDEEALRKIAEMALANGGQDGLAVFTNTATSRGESDEAQFAIPVTMDFKPVAKKMEQRVDRNEKGEITKRYNIMDCTITLNPGRLKLNDGQPMYMTDSYSSTLSVIFDSIKVKTVPEDRAGDVSFDFSKNVGTFLVPDQTKVTITYEALIVSDNPSNATPVNNTAAMLKYDDHVSDNVTFDSTSTGETEVPEITLFKFGAGHMEKGLPGAVFQIYEAQIVTDEDGHIVYDNNGSPTFSFTPMFTTPAYGNKEIKFETDEKGIIRIALTQDDHGYNFLYSEGIKTKTVFNEATGKEETRVDWEESDLDKVHMYAAKEIISPTGYVQDNVYYRFGIVRADEIPIYGDYIFNHENTMTVRNYKASCDFELTKILSGNAAGDLTQEELDGINFTIVIDDGSEEGKPIMKPVVVEGQPDTEVVDESFRNIPLSAFVNGKYTFTGLGVQKYKIIEDDSIIMANHPDWQRLQTFLWEGIEGNNTFEVTANDVYNNINPTLVMTDMYTKTVMELQVQKKWQNTYGQAMLWPGTTNSTIDLYIKDGEALTPAMAGDLPISITLDGVKDNNGEAKAGTAVFDNLPALPDGKEYVALERGDDALAAYDVSYSDGAYSTFAQSGGAKVATIINRQKSTSITVNKSWKQFNTDTENNPPADATATFRLYAYVEGSDPSSAKRVTSSNDITVTGAPWTVTFDSLPIVNDNGQNLIYIVKEISCTKNFSPDYPDGQDYAAQGQTIYNHPGTVDMNFKKEWRNTFSNLWPDNRSITIEITRLLGYKVGEETYYQIETENPFKAMYVLTPDTCTFVEGSSVPKSWTGETLVPSWGKVNSMYTFSLKGLEMIGAIGEHSGTWTYQVSEVGVTDTATNLANNDYGTIYYYNGQALPGSVKSIESGGVIRNTGKSLTATFEKQWQNDEGEYVDDWPQDHVITVRLMRKFKYKDANDNDVIVDDQNGWTPVEFSIDANGIVGGSVNTHDDITVAENEGIYSFGNLVGFGVGRSGGTTRYGEYVYHVEEASVVHEGQPAMYAPDYQVNGSHTLIRNKKAPRIDIPVEKTWLTPGGAAMAAEEIVPVKVALYRKAMDDYQVAADDGHVEQEGKIYLPVLENGLQEEIDPVVQLDAGSWTYTYCDLPEYVADSLTEKADYLIKETAAYINGTWVDPSDHYRVTVTGDASGFTINNGPNAALVDVTAHKAWQNADGTADAPENASVVFQLYRDDVLVEGATVTLDGTADPSAERYESSAWTASWLGLDEFKEDGQTPYVYTIKESQGFAGYESDGDAVNGGTITNVELVEFSFIKVWLDVEQSLSGIGAEDCLAWPDDTVINVTIRRRDEHGLIDPGFALEYTIGKDMAVIEPGNVTEEDKAKYQLRRAGESKFYVFATDKALPQGYEYFVSEPEATDGYDAARYGIINEGKIDHAPDHTSFAANGEVIMNKVSPSYTLPESGGKGDAFYKLAGMSLIMLGVALWVKTRLKHN